MALGALFSHELIAGRRARARDTVPRHHGSRAPVVFLQDFCMRRLGTASVLGSIPPASTNPTIKLCLVDWPRLRHLLGWLVFWPSHAISSGDSLGAGCLTISQDCPKCSESNSGATRLEVGPRESRASSQVHIHTSSSPAVQATCQGGVVHAPEAALRGNSLPRTSGSPMLRAGGRHCRGVAMPVQEQKHHALHW